MIWSSITTWLIYWWPVVSHLPILDWYIDDLAYMTNMMFTPITDMMESLFSQCSTGNKGFLTSSQPSDHWSAYLYTVLCTTVEKTLIMDNGRLQTWLCAVSEGSHNGNKGKNIKWWFSTTLDWPHPHKHICYPIIVICTVIFLHNKQNI